LSPRGKGFLAADESGGTIKKRFAPIGVESTEEHRHVYRELLFTTPGAEEYISDVILFDETIRQSASDGTPFPELLAAKGIIPGIKVDMGANSLALADAENRCWSAVAKQESRRGYFAAGTARLRARD
jgi:fructose-bisphosphate aldolase, class I